jgi:hypothetical protein
VRVKAVPKWSLVLCVLALAWLAIAGVSHLQAERAGGIDVRLADMGCYGGAGSSAPSSDECMRAQSSYEHWWLLPLGAVALSVVLAAGFAWARTPSEPSDPPLMG